MAFGMFIRWVPRNILKNPGLTIASFLFVCLNFIITGLHIKGRFSFLKGIKIAASMPDGSKVKCRLPDLVTVSEVYLARVYDPLGCKDGSVIIDAGANIGLWALKTSGECRNSIIIAVEPSTENFNTLKRNLELNKVTNVIPVKAALSNTNGHTTLFVGKGDTTTASLIRQGNAVSERVRTVRLDDLLRELKIRTDGKVFAKIDVEGAEMKVLEGAPGLLKRKGVSLLMETHPEHIDASAVRDFLRSHGFDAKALNLSMPYVLARK